MGSIWYWLVAVMLVAYVVLDGFDMGVGVLHLFVARTNEERTLVLRSIGPVWDGNEVWLLAGGGTLYFAFPLVYASSFSGFYLPLMIVLWLLILRGVSIELRGHINLQVWQLFFDMLIGFSSILLAVFYGAALANVIRGVPLGEDSYFFLPLWTNWSVGPSPGILDWYTVISGVLSLVALTVHGGLYLALKTEGALQERARTAVKILWVPLFGLTELAKLHVEINEEKSRTVDLQKGESFAFLGFEFRRVSSCKGNWRPQYTPRLKKRTALLEKLKEVFQRFVSQPVERVIELINPILRGWVNYFAIGHSSRVFSYVKDWVEKKVRRHLMRNQKRKGYGWTKWSRQWFYTGLGLFNNYRVQQLEPLPKADPAR